MFHELCTTGRVHELARIHRFTAPWEAAASLQLRHGNPRALDAYLAHDRITADTLDEHLAHIVDRWRAVETAGGRCAITASSNDHVDTINTAIQTARLSAGDIDNVRAVPIGGTEHAHIGDIVVTRRNDRRLTTTTGEPVRNRETWTVADIDDTGGVTVSSNAGGGSVTLPVDYVREHLRLGYAATEHGNQGDTTTVGIDLVSAATTRRGLYVGATRGREENLILVITESHDLDEARDVLERVLTDERSDLPAITQRRALAQEARPATTPNRPQLQQRCETPTWFDELITTLSDERRRAHDTNRHFDNRRDVIAARLRKAKQRRDHAAHLLERHDPGRAAAHREVKAAQERVWSTSAELRRVKGLERRRARQQVEEAGEELAAAQARQQNVEAAALPNTKLFGDTDVEVRVLRTQLKDVERERRTALGSKDINSLDHLPNALCQWRRWAEGRPVTADAIVRAVEVLYAQRVIGPADVDTLVHPLVAWAEHRGIDTKRAIQQALVERGPELDIGL